MKEESECWGNCVALSERGTREVGKRVTSSGAGIGCACVCPGCEQASWRLSLIVA